MIIHDPDGQYAKVDSEHRLTVSAVNESILSHAARVEGLAFTWTIVSYDYDAADTILLVRNDSTTKMLYIDFAWAWIKTAGAILLQHPTATFTIAGTAVTGVNMNTSSGVAGDATAKADETGNTQGDIIDMKYNAAAAGPGVEFLGRDGVIALGYHDALGIDAVAGGDECLASMHGYFHEVD